ncbi:alpha/beta hydrolase [Roseibium sp. AS2]|uniref:alpha/beta hydrolase n=1 Tax=Roseibium sp. AS2 TaxID=3135781 RepID=UPI00317C8984
MTETMITDWDDAYANAAHIPGAEAYIERWAEDAAEFRKSWMEKDLDIVYGEGARRRFDMFRPDRASKGLVVFVHGGYWLRFDKTFWSHFSGGALAGGWTTCMPSYDLAPAVGIADITGEIAAAITAAARRVGGPIRLTGHSAGGHLVTRMICEDSPLPTDVLERIERVVSISGLHDLRPLRNTTMNASFRLSEEEAMAESPALQKPATDCPVIAWVGGAERPEFLRQARLLADAWPNASYREDPERHHFDVIDGLKNSESTLTRTLLAS